MKGTCGKCTANMDPPVMSVIFTHLEHGSVMGYYCKAECMLEDTVLAMRHLIEQGNLDDIPNEYLADGVEPVFIEDASDFDPTKAIPIESIAGNRSPYYNSMGYGRSQMCASNIINFIDTCRTTGVVDVTDEDGTQTAPLPIVNKEWVKKVSDETIKSSRGFLIPTVRTTYRDPESKMEFSIIYDDSSIYVRFPENAYDITIENTGFSGSHNSHILTYIGMVKANLGNDLTHTLDASTTLQETKVALVEDTSLAEEVAVYAGEASIAEDVPSEAVEAGS